MSYRNSKNHETPMDPESMPTGNNQGNMTLPEVESSQWTQGSLQLPRPYHILGVKIMAYSHPRAQACLLGCVLFLTVGTYNVITFLGGAGQQTAYLSDVANITLYTVFAAFCIVAPAALNYFGLRLTLCFGGFGYAAYAASLWCFNHTGNTGFVIFGGAWCGLSAAMLWCAEGTAITAFASENKKGLYVSIMWSIFQSGVVIGAAIPVGQNWNAGSNNQSRVDDGTYIGLLILILFGAFLSLVLYPWQKMVREDGSKVLVERHQSFFQELQSSWQVFKTHTWIILFWPWCWAINYYNVYQSNNFNGVVFTVRARALNVLCSGIVQIFAAWVLQLITDGLPAPRRTRAFAGAAYNFVVFNAVWIGGYYAMVRTRENLPESERLDVYDSGYGAWAFLYVMYGFMDATYNCYAYWFMGALSNDPVELSVYTAMFRLLNSLCQITGYALNLQNYSKEFMFGTSWAFVAIGPIFVLPIIKYWMKDTNMRVMAYDLASEDLGDTVANARVVPSNERETKEMNTKEVKI